VLAIIMLNNMALHLTCVCIIKFFQGSDSQSIKKINDDDDEFAVHGYAR